VCKEEASLSCGFHTKVTVAQIIHEIPTVGVTLNRQSKNKWPKSWAYVTALMRKKPRTNTGLFSGVKVLKIAQRFQRKGSLIMIPQADFLKADFEVAQIRSKHPLEKEMCR
jgi:hypothetical protein